MIRSLIDFEFYLSLCIYEEEDECSLCCCPFVFVEVDFSWGVFFVFKISVNGERPIPIFDLVSQVFLCLFLVLGGERHKRGVEIHIYPCF